jgi:hypothetical protein
MTFAEPELFAHGACGRPRPAPPEKTPVAQAAMTEEESAANNFVSNLQRAACADGLDAERTLDNALIGLDKPNRPRDDDLDAGKKWLA